MRNRVIIVDDEKDMVALLERIITSQRDFEVLKAGSGPEALELLDTHDIDLVLADMKMPGMDGIQLLENVKRKWPEKTVVIITGVGTIENAVEAMKKGAYDYITKPFQHDDLLLVLDRAFERVRLIEERQYLRSELADRSGFSQLIGLSEPMTRIYETIRSIAGTSAPVLITGESGTGKELAARALHYESKRKDRRFVAVNCGALPETIVESEFFGHAKGAFTGAVRDKKGLVEEADGGTLFLDEVGDLRLPIQVKLLRVLQDGEFRPVGDNNDRKVDLRIISASNKDLETAINKGAFREDLYYRLKVITIHMPPLRERRDDIPLLVKHFTKKYSEKYEKNISEVTKSAMEALVRYDWKGNVRELENVIARAVAMAEDGILSERLLFGERIAFEPTGFKDEKRKALMDFYKRYITSALIRHNGNVTKTAEECGMMRQSLQQIMRRCGIDPEEFR